MKKMTAPLHDPLATYDACVAAIGDFALRSIFSASRASIHEANVAFDAASQHAGWCALPRVPNGNPDVQVAGALTKRHLMDLYSDRMVGTTGPSRDIYDALMAAAGGFCPFCGELGQVRTLDHYLPKANFPRHSVLPKNLVPCCRDCNTGKNAAFGAQAHEQALHPYLDLGHFFDERWVVAKVARLSPILVRYECIPPAHWSDTDKMRVRSHFDGYKLAYRFSLQAGGEAAKVVELRSQSLRRLTPEDFREYLVDNANSTDFVLNGWSRTMYAAFAATNWFVEADFTNEDWHLSPLAVQTVAS
ncbi:MAG: HNH endonuclease [Sphingobium sp.]|nr:MAG: HNH endonuclease [Sphingobium sp.]